MTLLEFIQKIKMSVPDKKDLMLADKICTNYTNRAVKANEQLRKIKNDNKFFRRCKAFLDNGIKIYLVGTMYYEYENDLIIDFVDNYVSMIKIKNEAIKYIKNIEF